jgi:hypothetical protein
LCGPSTITSVDSFKTNGEIIPIAALSCAAVNANENFDVAINPLTDGSLENS